MSNKTMKQRIALVAVSALTAGVLSVASAPVANAAAFTADTMIITTGQAVNLICADTSTTTTQSATIPKTSAGITIQTTAVGVNASDDKTAYAVVTGPGSISAVGSLWSLVSATEASAADLGAESAAADTRVTIKPSGVGTIKVSLSSTDTSAVLDVITITVVDSCGGGTYSAATSLFTIVDVLEADSDETAATTWATNANNIDTLNENLVVNAGTGYIRFKLLDEYGVDLGDKALIASVSSGCVVGLAAITSSAPSIATTSSTAVLSDDGADNIIAVEQATDDVPATCTVTASWNGITVGTKTFSIQGAPAKITVSDVTVGYRGSTGSLRATVTDAAGNALASKTVTGSTTEATNVASASVATVSGMSASTAAVTGKTPALADGSNLNYTCTSKGGAAKLTVRVAADAGSTTYITSAPFDVYCGEQAVDTFTLAMDKASYSPGEIATLTVSAKGAYGTPVYTLAQMGAAVAAGFGGMEFVTAPTTADYFNSGLGTRTYQLKVGTTEGAFVGTFKLTAATDTAAKTVQYKIASSTATVSNADVLKSIVALIASINKQIQALQKLILKR